MQLINIRYLVIGIAMLAAAGLAVAITPREKIADNGPKVVLETMIPKQFGEWKVDETVAPLLADPKQTAVLNKIYNQTLSRTYVNSHGERVMLSIAYGGDQSDSMAVHKPEVCYPAQGFQILKNINDTISTGNGSMQVKRLVAIQGKRVEPITYWITVGDNVALSGVKWKIEQMKYGLTGKIPDGLLFRISNINLADRITYETHDMFINSLLNVLSAEQQIRLIGRT